MHGSEYYRLSDDNSIPRRWFLGGARTARGEELDTREFLHAKCLDVSLPLSISVRRSGEPLDFTLGDFDMPVVRAPIGDAIAGAGVSDVQLLEARIEGREEAYVVVSVLRSLDCFDRELSKFDVWTNADGRADPSGRLKTVYQLRVRRPSAPAPAIFRITGWKTALIVNADLATLLAGVKGVSLQPV